MVLQAVVTTLDAVFVGWLGRRRAGRRVARLSARDADADDVGGRHGRWRRLGGRARARRRPAGRGGALAAHAVVIALVMARCSRPGLLLGGPAIYRAIGAPATRWRPRSPTRASCSAAPSCSGWSTRWAASSAAPARWRCQPRPCRASLVYLALAPAGRCGWGPFPRLGMAGTAIANLGAFGLAILCCSAISLAAGSVRLTFPGLHSGGPVLGDPAGRRPRLAEHRSSPT